MTILDRNSLISEYACCIALGDLVENHDLLPHQLRNEEGQYLNEYQSEFDKYFNTHYAQLVKLSQSPLDNGIDEMWNKYIVDNDTEPMFALCEIQYLDTPNEKQEAIIKMCESCGESEDEDEKIFYYCGSLKDLKHLTGEGCIDFKVTKVIKFTAEL